MCKLTSIKYIKKSNCSIIKHLGTEYVFFIKSSQEKVLPISGWDRWKRMLALLT